MSNTGRNIATRVLTLAVVAGFIAGAWALSVVRTSDAAPTKTLLGAIDGQGFAASASVPSLPSGSTARSALTAAMTDLQSLLPTGNKDADKHISNAIDDLSSALQASAWVGSDGNHVDPKKSGMVFDKSQQAVKELMAIKPPVPAAIQGDIDLIDGAARLLASVEYGDNACNAKKPNELAAAQTEGTAGDTEYTKNHYDAAIDHYQKAWQHALNADGNPCSFPITGSVTGLYPGATVNLQLTVTNPSTYNITVSNLTAVVGNASTSCAASNLTVGSSPTPFALAAGTSANATIQLTMIASAANACQGATFPLTYTAQVTQS